jgi:hypothetical protein
MVSRLRVRRLFDLGFALGMFDRDAPLASQFDDFPHATNLPSYLNVSQPRNPRLLLNCLPVAVVECSTSQRETRARETPVC